MTQFKLETVLPRVNVMNTVTMSICIRKQTFIIFRNLHNFTKVICRCDLSIR